MVTHTISSMNRMIASSRIVDSFSFIERLRKLRAIDPGFMRFDKYGHKIERPLFTDIKISLRLRPGRT